MKGLRGRNAIVTGASRGIGTYIAKTLAAQGVNLVLAARSADKLEDTRRACELLGVRAVAVPADVGSRDDLRRLVETAERELGPIDILVNNAGIEVTASVSGHSFDQVDDIIRTNLNAPIWLTKMVLQGMVQRRRGAIVNVASLAGKSGTAYNGIYCASKHGLIGFTSSLEMELDGTGVTAGTVCPGFVSEAGMWADSGGKAPALMREVSPQKCANAVINVIRGSKEEIVSSGPIRPLLALGQLFPSLPKFAIKRLGILNVLRERARRVEAEQEAGVPVR